MMRQETLISSKQQGGMQTLTNQKGQQLEAWCRVLELLAGLEVSPPLLERQQGSLGFQKSDWDPWAAQAVLFTIQYRIS